MQFAYEDGLLYSLVLGNGRLNVAFAGDLSLRRLFYPIDVYHDCALRIGIYEKDRRFLKWLSFKDVRFDNFILVSPSLELFVDAYEPVLAIRVQQPRFIGVLWAMRLEGSARANSSFHDRGILYFNKRSLAFGLSGELVDYSIGHNVEDHIGEGYLDKHSFAMGACSAAGVFSPHTLYLCAGHSVREVEERLRALPPYAELKRRTIDFWKQKTKSNGEPTLFTMSQYVLHILQHPGGGVLAAPECDPDFRHCGGYGFCWPRDAAYIAKAFLLLDWEESARKLLDFLAHLNPHGEFFQRYYLNGQPAPSWCEQIDQTGSFLWIAGEYYKKYGKIGTHVLESVERGAHFLEKKFAVPFETTDLWEERKGMFAYSCAAAYRGLVEAYELCREFKREHRSWLETARDLKTSFSEVFIHSGEHRYVRAADAHHGVIDGTVDASLIGLAVPFGVVEKNDVRMRNTIKKIEERLVLPSGVMRYEGDVYPYGNSAWNVCSAWLAWYYREVGKEDRASFYLTCVEKSANAFSLLAEQVTESSKPKWVVPLAWSHAMYLIAKHS